MTRTTRDDTYGGICVVWASWLGARGQVSTDSHCASDSVYLAVAGLWDKYNSGVKLSVDLERVMEMVVIHWHATSPTRTTCAER